MFRNKLAAMHGLHQQLTLTSLLAMAVVASTAGCGNRGNTSDSSGTTPQTNPHELVTQTEAPVHSSEVINDEVKINSVVHGYKSVVNLSNPQN